MMSSIEKRGEKMREGLSPMYDSPLAFWSARVEAAEALLKHQQELASRAALQAARWQNASRRTEIRLKYLRKRLETAKIEGRSPSGPRPKEIAERWMRSLRE